MSFMIFAKKRICSTIFTPRDVRPILACCFSSNIDLKTPPFMVKDYLISTFGFSPAKAAAISKPIAHLKSPQNPDAVRRFLQHQGFDEGQVKTIIARSPGILCSSPENNLATNLLDLRNVGLSASALTQIILSGPIALRLCSAVSKIKFWKDFVGGKEEVLVKVFKRNMGLICHDIAGGIATKISLLQSRGISTPNIQWIVSTVPNFITRSVSSMEDLLKRAQELGIQPESKMFLHGLRAMSLTRDTMHKKMELFKSRGWSDDDFLSAVRKYPHMLCLSEENLRATMDFLLGEAKCDMSYIIFRPMLLMYSLEKRLRPRYHVLHLLESKGLSEKRKEFCRAVELTEDKFAEKYVLPHRDTIPELHEAYLAARASESG